MCRAFCKEMSQATLRHGFHGQESNMNEAHKAYANIDTLQVLFFSNMSAVLFDCDSMHLISLNANGIGNEILFRRFKHEISFN